MQLSGRSLRGWAAAATAAVALALSTVACGGGSAPTSAAPPTHSQPASSAPAATAPAASGNGSDALACRTFHKDAVYFATNVRNASDVASVSAAYAGFEVPVQQDQSGTENTPLFGLLDTLSGSLSAQASAEMGGNNPSNSSVVSALNAVFAFCQPLDPSENWSTGN